ncbi:MAG: C4-dicarboxylate ABC transporter substrate-binding protein, partial [Oscillibacter sp.]|nr:C4-dicarboxylate ABC transporter substrate-binding protein [Oscillibacter sp.]
MKKKLTALFASLLCMALLAACGGGSNSGAAANDSGSDAGEPAAQAGGASLKFTTGGDQGTYYAFGSVLAGQVTNSTATNVTAITSGGSKANIQALADGDAELGFVQSDVMAYGYNGTRLFDAPETGFSTVAALYMEQVQIV